ncbi:hypothetical protein SOPP22_10670 [Shewanella sp. OPT22]|nr:hypothetical protein SOPP22_10670 [Shewanella sp. OPT22]
MKKACVIGAGLSGLCSIKELKEVGIDVTCFEKGHYFGGGLSKRNDSGTTYESLMLTVSNYFIAFSAHPISLSEGRRYWTPYEYERYLESYMQAFSLDDHIQFGITVNCVDKLDQGYKVIFEDEEGRILERYFDYVVVCTGTNRVPNKVKLPNEAKFKGKIVHTSEYNTAEDYKGASVVCIGGGESGVDIAHEISQFAKETVLLTRDTPSIIPRWIRQQTNDAYASQSFDQLGADFSSLFMKLKAMWNLRFNKNITEKERYLYQYTLNCSSMFNRFLTKNDNFIDSIVEGKLRHIISPIEQLDEEGVLLENGDYIQADVIVLNTGYSEDFSFLNSILDVQNVRDLYKHMICPEVGSSLAFIGWVRPSQGGVPACSEMQARYLAQLLIGNLQLPKVKQLRELISLDKEYEERLFYKNAKLSGLVNYHQFMRSLAQCIGCLPNIKWYLNPLMAYKMWFGSHLSNFYRLNGVGAQSKISKRMILEQSVAPSLVRNVLMSTLTILSQFTFSKKIAQAKEAKLKRKTKNEAY